MHEILRKKFKGIFKREQWKGTYEEGETEKTSAKPSKHENNKSSKQIL